MSKWEGSSRGLEAGTGQKHPVRQFLFWEMLKIANFSVFLPVSHRNSTDGFCYLHAVQFPELSNLLNAQPSISPTEKHPNPILKHSIVNSTFCFVSGCRALYHRRKWHSCADWKKHESLSICLSKLLFQLGHCREWMDTVRNHIRTTGVNQDSLEHRAGNGQPTYKQVCTTKGKGRRSRSRMIPNIVWRHFMRNLKMPQVNLFTKQK